MIKDGNIAKNKVERHLNILAPMYERARETCEVKGQTHLREWEFPRLVRGGK